jgi:hypothetical protein
MRALGVKRERVKAVKLEYFWTLWRQMRLSWVIDIDLKYQPCPQALPPGRKHIWKDLKISLFDLEDRHVPPCAHHQKEDEKLATRGLKPRGWQKADLKKMNI